jgi:hypothetical protein
VLETGVEATTGFEPVNRGFADVLLPQGYLDSCLKRSAGAAPDGSFRCELPTKLPTTIDRLELFALSVIATRHQRSVTLPRLTRIVGR